jgi:uncharacterized protein YceH (UPF0502 family)
MEPTAAEIRVLGALIEKQRTTPDQYPLTANSLRLACNQSTNRDPVVEYDPHTVRISVQRLRERGWVRFASGPGSRAAKYRQLFDDALGLASDEVAVLCVLMLRGPQTPGELKQRCDRLHGFADLAAVQATLDRLTERELVRRLERRPGQKEDRFEQLVGGGEEDGAPPEPEPEPEPGPAEEAPPAEPPPAELATRVETLERRVAELAGRLAELQRELGL